MDTPSKIITGALKLFAERGFYGASMDHIGREVGLTKQALIHHFGSKEKLYGAVLEQISQRLLAELEQVEQDQSGAPEQAFGRAVLLLYQRSLDNAEDTQLLMRELLDNRRRAAQAGTWYLRPFLDGLVQMLRQNPRWSDVPEAEVATHVYQLLGAVNYFAVSLTTLENMYSTGYLARLRQEYPQQLWRMAGHRFSSAQPGPK